MSYLCQQSSSGYQVRVQLGLFALLCTLYQSRLPYHVAGVDSNDSLYFVSESYRGELLQLIDSCVAETMSLLLAAPEK